MMDGCADRGQGLARDGVFGELFDSDYLLAARADTTSSQQGQIPPAPRRWQGREQSGHYCSAR
jgi:hypothetical protein